MDVVSVIVPTYNSQSWVAATIDNLAQQTYPHLELIVVDDGSRDATVATVREKLSGFGRPWRVLELGANRGPSAARNAGLRAAAGAWVQFLDSDDFLAPVKLERQMRTALDARADVSALCSAWRRCYADDGNLSPEGDLAAPRSPSREPLMCLVGIDRPLLGAALARRATLVEIGGFDESLRFWECEELFARLAAAGRLEVVASSEPFYWWRMPGEQAYIGGRTARYASTTVALGWIELVLKQSSGRGVSELDLTDAERAQLLDDCTVWARILFASDRRAFRQFVALARRLAPRLAPTHPPLAAWLAPIVGYEAAERVVRAGRIPRALKNRALSALKRGRRSGFDWK